MIYYRECIMRFQKQLEALKRRDPSVFVDLRPETLPDDGGIVALQAVITEMNSRYEIYVRLRNEVDRVQKLMVAREAERAALLLENLEKVATLRRDAPHALRAREFEMVHRKMELAAARLDFRVDDVQRTKIQTMLQRALSATEPGSAELLLSNLRIQVERANKALHGQEENNLQAEDEVFEALQRASKEGVSPPGSRDDDAGKAAVILKNALEELGYEVQSDFATAFVEGKSSFFQQASWGEYHCQVTSDPNRERLNFNIVRYGQNETRSVDGSLQDREMEENWCSRLPELLGNLARRNLVVDLDRKFEAGSIELQTTADPRLKPKSRKGSTGEQKRMTRTIT